MRLASCLQVRRFWAVTLATLLGVSSCEDEEVTHTRGVPGGAAPGAKAPAKRGGRALPASGAQPSSSASGDAEETPRPLPTLDTKTFARIRDPFRNPQLDGVAVPEVERAQAQRKVRMAQYRFEDLKLIAIVNSGRGIVPRALFLASDGKSGTIHQGEYFSSAEVLLAAVNRDYIEVEVVDEDLAAGLNLQRGERRAIYLRNE